METQSIKEELSKTIMDSGVAEGNGKEHISLDQLEGLTGISKKEILKELFFSDIEEEMENRNTISMKDLRDAMVKYLDKTLLK